MSSSTEGPSKTLVSGPSPLSSVIFTRTPSAVRSMLVLELRVAQPRAPRLACLAMESLHLLAHPLDARAHGLERVLTRERIDTEQAAGAAPEEGVLAQDGVEERIGAEHGVELAAHGVEGIRRRLETLRAEGTACAAPDAIRLTERQARAEGEVEVSGVPRDGLERAAHLGAGSGLLGGPLERGHAEVEIALAEPLAEPLLEVGPPASASSALGPAPSRKGRTGAFASSAPSSRAPTG